MHLQYMSVYKHIETSGPLDSLDLCVICTCPHTDTDFVRATLQGQEMNIMHTEQSACSMLLRSNSPRSGPSGPCLRATSKRLLSAPTAHRSDLMMAVALQLRHLGFQVRDTGLQLGRAHEGVTLVTASKLDLKAATLLVGGLLSSICCSQHLRQLVMLEARQLQLLRMCCMFSLSAMLYVQFICNWVVACSLVCPLEPGFSFAREWM